MKKLKWTVEFEIDPVWVADGFAITDQVAREMIEERLSFAHSHEVSAKVISAPTDEEIAAAEDWEDQSDRFGEFPTSGDIQLTEVPVDLSDPDVGKTED